MTAHAGISIPCCAMPVVREQANYALNFAGLDEQCNLPDSRQIACLAFYFCA
jgi:hypothetical protein